MAENPGRLLSPTIDADLTAGSGSLIDPPTDASAGEPDQTDDPGQPTSPPPYDVSALYAADHALPYNAADETAPGGPVDELFPSALTQELAETVSRRHVVVLREAGWRLPVAPILEFFAALLLELLFVALIVVLGMRGGLSGHGGRNHADSSSASAAAIGGVITQTSAVSTPKVPTSWHLSHRLPPPPSLPAELHTPVAMVFPHPDSTHNLIIGIPRQQNAWIAPTPDIAPRPARHAVGKGHARSRGPQPPGMSRLGRSRNYNPNAGLGPPISLFKGQHGGQSGAGMGRGRGNSDADGGVKVLSWGTEHVPIKYQIDPIYVRGTYRVWVSASGRVTKVKIIKSCGHPSMDQTFIDVLENTRFSPAISNGVPVSSRISITLSNGSRD
ncbi:MAG: energy transducer TonB family protein [Phycisphaerae bacterium]